MKAMRISVRVMEGTLSGSSKVQSIGRVVVADAERDKTEKSTRRRQSRNCNCYSRISEYSATNVARGSCRSWLTRLLDIYCLRTKPVNIKQYMVDIPLDNLLKDNYEAPKLMLKEYKDPKKSLRYHLSMKMVRQGWSKQRFPRGIWGSVPPLAPLGLLGPDTGLKIQDLPLHPVEDFMSRLNLGPTDSLRSLISQSHQTQALLDLNATNNVRVDSALVEHSRSNGSIPPLPWSYPPVGAVKPEHT
ncbi:hypothetical protein R1sor_007838 [Riccia sorocarpa]|uniref:Uncharacterized protein n=1 Tax=Riccia sorocarpa TaxID=122646 RepID=A0ABD3HRN2_9MARC